jgi:hypothetical protein
MLGAKGVPLGHNSIALGLQRYERGILSGDDFRHLLQHRQQPIWIAWEVIQHQRHSAILLAESRESQHFCSPRRARARDRAGALLHGSDQVA